MTRSRPPRKVTYFEPVLPRLARNTVIESTFEVGGRFRCAMRVDCGQLDPGAVIRPVPGEWHPRMPERLDDEELADWRAGRNAVRQPASRAPVGDFATNGIRIVDESRRLGEYPGDGFASSLAICSRCSRSRPGKLRN